MLRAACFLFLLSGLGLPVTALADGVPAVVGGGRFRPLYALSAGGLNKQETIEIRPFLLDRYPVTNAQFSAFAAAYPRWGKGRPSAAAAESSYLRHWIGSGSAAGPAPDQLASPVVNVSWFAAQEYCAMRGGRLPSVDEWEFAAAASETQADASNDPEFSEQILRWYAEAPAKRRLDPVGRKKPNFWGLYDMHGLVWEWNSDFNSVFVNGDNRRDGEGSKNLFCGDSAVSAADRQNYAAFMRYAFRNSLRASFTTENLGFRCAYDQN